MKLLPRHLTQPLKAEELARWERIKAEPRPDGFIGGLGYPDPEMFGWCDRINEHYGICTLQSCGGHKHPEGHVWSGQLWLWMTEATSREFNRRAYELVQLHPLIERVNRIYHDGGQEIADVIFRGNGSGELTRSMDVIVDFVESLS